MSSQQPTSIDSILQIDYTSHQSRPTLQQLLSQHKALIQQTIKQIHDLSSFHSHQTTQHQLVIAKMEANMYNYKNRILSLETDIAQITMEQEKITKEFEEEKEKTRKSIETTHLGQINDYLKKTEQLQTQYKLLRQLQQRQQGYITRISALQSTFLNLQYTHHDNMNKQQQVQTSIDHTVLQQNQHLLKNVKKDAPKVAINIVVTDKNLNSQKNVELKVKLAGLQQVLQKLKKQRKEMLERRKDVKVNHKIDEQQLEQYKAVGSLQKAKIKANKDKVETLKRTIATEMAKKQERIAQVKKEREANLKVLKLRLHRLDKEKQDLKGQGQKLKILGQTMLLQREEVQNFFLMAMQATKKEVETGQVKQRQTEKHYGEKVDIEELLPKDKQRIITNLYTKLALTQK